MKTIIKPSKSVIILWISLLVMTGISMYQHRIIQEQNKYIDDTIRIELDTIDRIHVNHDNIVYWANTFGIKHVDIVSRQAILECGHKYDSNSALINNNLFGFVGNSGYRKFNHWIESIAYYKQWQSNRYKEQEYLSYYLFLSDIGYAEDSLYNKKLKEIKPRTLKDDNSIKY